MKRMIVLAALAASLMRTGCDAGTLDKWVEFGDGPIFLEVSSSAPYKVLVDGRLGGWAAGGAEPTCFRLVNGRGFRCARVVTETGSDEVSVNVVHGPVAQDRVSGNVLGSVKFESSEGRHWLYHVADGKTLVFRANGIYRGFPSATVRCNRPGRLVARWGDREMVFDREKPGKVPFAPVVLTDADRMSFTAESGAFEIGDLAFTTVSDSTSAAMTFASSDAKRDAAFRDAKRVCNIAKMAKIAYEGIGLKKIDEREKTVTVDPTVRNGLLFCGVKLPVADGVLDLRWKRETADEMATATATLPAGWKLLRRFDMQGECQRLVDEAIADGLQGGIQFCAYRDGKCIVNVCGGTLAKDGPAVGADSLFPIFSTEKPLLATACHRAVEQGRMDYDKPLCTWWPELKQHSDGADGKDKLTLRETLAYRTCLPGGAPGGKRNPVSEHELTTRELADWKRVCDVAAADRPHAPPGTTQAYLPYAYAWMIGHPLEVAMGKPLKQVLDEEVLIPSGIEREFYFVVPREEYPRVATYYCGAFCENMNEDWARQALMPSAWAVSSAQALCKFYNRLCGYDGRSPLIRKETLDAALKPCRHVSDPLPSPESMKRDWFMIFGMGYGLWGSAERMDRVFGHGGAGGSEALVDRDQKLIVAFTCNYCKNVTGLRDRLYEVVGMRWRYWNDNVNIQDLQMTTSAGGNFGSGITSR